MADFDPKTHSVKDLKNAPVEVVKTELNNLAKALGISPAEVFRAVSGTDVAGGAGDLRATRGAADCCSSDNW